MTIFYCPACGETSDLQIEIVLQPGSDLEIVCPKCGIVFRIVISFFEVSE